MRKVSTGAPARARRAVLAGLVLSLATGSRGAESLAVVAVGEPATGIDADLAELTHQLRAACRDRVGNVLDVPTMQARLLGQSAGATLSELDRAYGGALAVFQNGEFESALRTLRAIVDDLEALPETRESYAQWIRASQRLAHAAMAVGRLEEADAALGKLLRVEPNHRADPDQYSPTFRRRLDEVRARIRTLPQRRMTVVSSGRSGTLFVEGRPSGTTPMTLFLPAGRYRIGGAAGALRVPSFQVDLSDEDRTVVLDFDTAEAIRMSAGPGLLLPAARRAEGLIRAGAWLDADRLVVAARSVEGDAPFLAGAIYDVRRGSLLREGSVRTVAGTVPSVNIGALAAFLLTGAQQREVRARTSDRVVPPEPLPIAQLAPSPAPASAAAPVPPPVPPPPPMVAAGAPPPDLRPRPPTREEAGVAAAIGPPSVEASPAAGGSGERHWRKPAAWVAGGCSLGFAALAVGRRVAANDAYDAAHALLGGNGVLASSSDVQRYRELKADGDAAARQSWIAAGVSAAFAVAAGYFGWTAWSGPDPAVHF
jgi:tetratricopeptide (TPR) repeat protein